ncbi:centrosomal protein 20-like [Symsagittifera roscoffensis]|uniref:centrosomal protein 20-like n=1 Tax=Symsagittifera roscoffensis TaxID=84072 RepID=UPI00307C2501
MTDVTEFKKLVMENLNSKGVLQQIQANLRSEIFKSLHETDSVAKGESLCQENLVINELIREYLEYNKHQNSLSVFQMETGTPKNGVDREFVKSDLNLEESGTNMQKLPLIYGIVSMLQSIDQHKKIQTAFSKTNRTKMPSQVREPNDQIRIGGESRSMYSTLSDDAASQEEEGYTSIKNARVPDSGRQSAASIGMAGYSANDFEVSSENDDSSSRRKTPSVGSSGPSRETSFNGYSHEKYGDYDEDDDDDEDYLTNSVNVMAIEDLAPVD